MIYDADAPGRCGIIGNPSDIYGGCVVSCSVPVRARCRLTVPGIGSLPSDRTLWDAATARFPLDVPCDVEWSSDVPASSGLAGSTALLAATLACVLAARGSVPALSSVEDRTAFAELVRDVERNEAGVVCGYQDAYMAVHGGLQRMDFSGKHPVEAGPPGSLRSLSASLPFLLVTTGVRRLSGSVHGPMVERWLAGEASVVSAMTRLAELGRLGSDALEAGDWAGLAAMMKENQAISASLGGSGSAIDRLILDCEKCGALAAKLAGAGFGGTVIALSLDVAGLEAGLRGLGYEKFLRPSVEAGLRVRG